MDSAEHECAFFAGKLGMLFNMHNDRLTIVGLDSHLYGQATANVVVSPTKSEALSTDSDEASKAKYQDVISLLPTGVDGMSSADHAVSFTNSSAPTQNAQHPAQNTADNKELAAAKILSAFADFDDNNSPRSEEPSPICNTEHQVSQPSETVVAIEAEAQSQPLPGEDINFATTRSTEEGLIPSDSYEDFQNTLVSMSGSAKHTLQATPFSGDAAASSAADMGIDLSLEMPHSEVLLSLSEGSPFDVHASDLERTEPDARKSRTFSKEEKPNWLPPASAPPPLPLTPPPAPSAPPPPVPTSPAPAVPSQALGFIPDEGQEEEAVEDGYEFAKHSPNSSQFAALRERTRILQMFGFDASYVNKSQISALAKAVQATCCEEKKWVLDACAAEQFIGCSVEYVNGVKVRDLDPAFQQALVKQRSRPLFIRFRRAIHLDEPGQVKNNAQGVKSVAPAVEKFKYALFMAKYTSTAAAKIRSTVDSTLQDYVKCNWAEVKAKNEGLPWVTIVSIYKYIEFEMNKLELFSHYHARGYGVPAEMLESHWDDVRNHIEAMVFRAVGPHTRTLWPIFSADNKLDRYEADEFVDAENAASDLKTNTFIGVDLNITDKDVEVRNERPNWAPQPEITTSVQPPVLRAAPPIVELSAEHPLRMKLAFLRFVTLESTGLDCGDKPKPVESSEDGPGGRASLSGEDHTDPELETPQAAPVCAETLQEQISGPAARLMIQKIRRVNRIMLRHKEEWYLAMRGLCRAMQLETPGEVLQALVNTVKLISHALDGYMNRPVEDPKPVESVLQESCAKCNAYRGSHIACSCGGIHFVTEPRKEVTMTLSSALHFPHSENENLPGEKLTELFAGKRCVTLASDSIKNELSGTNTPASEGSASKSHKEHRPLSADDLMPAITWVLIQANPPNIEYVIWMCSEFRHPGMLRGEEAFCLAQLSSAVEFCKHATHRAFDIPHCDYNALMLSYNSTLKLLLACKTGNLEQVKELVETGNADINGLSPDHKDSPLTACVKFGRHAILRYLLSRPEIDPDCPVQLFHGPGQRSTPLMLAVQYNQLEMVIDLVVAGADRHYCNDSGNSALSTAIAHNLGMVSMVLKADPTQCELVSQIIEGNKHVVIGLLLQKVSVNYVLQPENSLSPLIAAVLRKDRDTIRFLLNKRLCATDVNLANRLGETALIACAKEFAQNPAQDFLNIAAMLLRFGANRHLRDNSGRSAFDYIRSARDVIKALEREVHNPFNEKSVDALPPPPPVAAPAVPPPKVTASTITAPTKKRHSAIVPPDAPSPFIDPAAPNASLKPTVPATDSAVGADGSKLPPEPETPSPAASAPPMTPTKINPVHKQLLKEFSCLLLNDPLSEDIAPIFELARDKRMNEVRALLHQGVNVNAVCVSKGYSALIAAVYNSDLPMLKLILQADAICKRTYFSTQYSVISAIRSVINGTPDTLEADAELLVNEDGVAEGEKGGYLRVVNSSEPMHISDDGEVKLVSKRNIVDLDRAGRNGMRALHYASQIGDITIVGALLQAGAAREVFNDKLHTPLDVCVANDHINAANAIRFDPEKVSICLAAKHGDWTVMSALLCQGVSINTKRNHMSKTGDQVQHELYTPLLAAAAHGQFEVMKKILDVPEVNVNLANSLNQTALMFAAARGDEQVVLLLLNRGADRWVLDKQGYIATAWAESRSRESIALILKHDPARIWIHDVIRNNDFPAVIAMLKQKVDPNQRRTTKLVPHSPANSAGSNVKIDAVGSNKAKTAPVAAKAPAVKVNSSIDQQHDQSGGVGFIMGETPLIVAARYGRLDVIAILLKAPAPNAVDMTLLDSAGNSALHHASLKGHEEAVLLLLKAHAPRHLRNSMGLSASAIAKSAGHINIGAIVDADPYTVHIHDMCEQGDMRMVIALLKQGCPVNYQDPRASKRLQTPLMAASIGGQADIVRALLRYSEAQEHIDDQDSIGRTSLMRAASVGALSVTAILLNAGCDRTLKDHAGLTARDHASKHSYTVMFQFISQSMVR